jgi:hypothetical protein
MNSWATEGSGQYNYSGSEAMDDNSTNLTCEQLRQLGNPHLVSAAIANPLRYLQLTFYMICYPTALLLNVFVIFIIARFKKLHTTTFYLALQIIVANLANIIVYYPYSSANAIADKNVSLALCPALGFITSFLLAARNLLMFVLVADRFCLILMPFRYSRHRVRVVIPLSIGGWMLALTVSVVPLIGLRKCYALTRVTWVCIVGRGCDMQQCNSYSIFVTTLNSGGTFIAFLLYLALYCKAKKIRNRIEVASLPNESAEAREVAKEARKRDRRANATFMILFGALIGVTLPAFISTNLTRAVGIFHTTQNTTPTPRPLLTFVSVVLTNIYLLIFITDPIVIMRNQDVREVMVTIKAKLRPGSGRRDQTTNETDM